MKKLIPVILSCAMLLAACGSSASTDSVAASSEAASTSTAATTEAAGEGSGAYTGTPIKIGGIGPVTGGAAIYGQAVKNAEELAVKEINAAGGVNGKQLELSFQDSQGDPESAVAAYGKLMDWGMNVSLGAVLSGETASVVAAAKAECELVVPDAEDITFLEAEKFTSKVDYGGYTAPLAFLGRHAAGNAAVAVELALALWRKGFEIPDEAILAGLAAVENRSSIRVLSQKPLIILDACRTPQQAAALLRVLNMAKVRHMSAVIGLTEEEGAESFLAALETGLTSEEQKKDKSTMPGMGENPFDKVFLVAPAGTEAALAERLTEKARYHFDAVFCPTLAEAVEQAKANSRRGLLVCGSEAIALEAEKLLENR